MNHLIIIGNGFDLAHGLKTSYSNFIWSFVETHKKGNYFEKGDRLFYHSDPGEVKRLFDRDGSVYSNDIQRLMYHKEPIFENKLLKQLFDKFSTQNWCDVEKEYFQELLKLDQSIEKADIHGHNVKTSASIFESSKELNEDFEAIKKQLESYLESEQEKARNVGSYQYFFNHLISEKIPFSILNFNYTKTINRYFKNIEDSAKIFLNHIHGRLNDKKKPIVFGYAANDEESRTLIEKGDNELMKNIKKHCYKRTNNQTQLINYLDVGEFKLTIFGHSSGISDKLILNQVYNHENLKELRVFYHEDHPNYFDLQVNIDRIMNNDNNFHKLVSFEDSIKMPQHNESLEDHGKFAEYIKNNYKNETKKNKST